MSIEQLNKIVEMVNSLGANAKEGFLYYLGFNLVIELISYGVGVLALVLMYKILSPLASISIVDSRASVAMKTLRGILKIGSNGYLSNGEIDQIVTKVQRLNTNKGE